MSLSQGASCKGRKKALLIAVEHVKGVAELLPQTHNDAGELRELLISQYGYAEDDIVMLLDDAKLDKSVRTYRRTILEKIKWLVEDLGEHDRLVFYYTGCCGTELVGKDQFIYAHSGARISNHELKYSLVDPVLKTKGCRLFALFDCSHSEAILDLKHSNCYSIPSHTSGMSMDVPARMLNSLLEGKPLSTDGPVGIASVRQPVFIDTDLVSSTYFMSRLVTSPIGVCPEGDCLCDITEEEEEEGHVVCLSACRDNEIAYDDNEARETFTKFFMSSLEMNSSISFQDLLDDLQPQVDNLHAKRAVLMQGQRLRLPRRQYEILSESDIDAVRTRSQEPRITSSRPLQEILEATLSSYLNGRLAHESAVNAEEGAEEGVKEGFDDPYDNFFVSPSPDPSPGRNGWRNFFPSLFQPPTHGSMRLHERLMHRFSSCRAPSNSPSHEPANSEHTEATPKGKFRALKMMRRRWKMKHKHSSEVVEVHGEAASQVDPAYTPTSSQVMSGQSPEPVIESIPRRPRSKSGSFPQHVRPRSLTVYAARPKKFYVRARRTAKSSSQNQNGVGWKWRWRWNGNGNVQPPSAIVQPGPVMQTHQTEAVAQPIQQEYDFGCWGNFCLACWCVDRPVISAVQPAASISP